MQKLMIRDRDFYMTTLRIALPIVVQNAITMLINIIGTMMLGHYGEIPLSAAALANEFINIFFILCMGIGGGAGVLTAQYWGNRDIAGLKHTITLMLWIILSVAAVFTTVTYAMPATIMGLYTDDPAIVAQGVLYFRAGGACYPMMGITLTVTIVLRTVRQVKVPLLAAIASVCLNAFLSWVLIFGHFGAPELRIQGAAIAMVIAQCVEMSVIAGYLLLRDRRIGYRLRDVLHTDARQAKLFLRYGAPVIVSDAMLAVGNTMVAVIMGHIGASFVAANAIVSPVMRLSTVLNQGVSQSSGVLVGNTLGAGDRDLAQRQSVTYLILSVLLGIFGAVVVLLVAPLVLSSVAVGEETRRITFELMAAVAVTTLFFTVQGMLTKGVLRAGGDTRFLMLADVLFLWVASIPLGYLAGLVWGLSPFWVYLALKTDWIIKSFWCTQRLRSRKWLHVVNEAIKEG